MNLLWTAFTDGGQERKARESSGQTAYLSSSSRRCAAGPESLKRFGPKEVRGELRSEALQQVNAEYVRREPP